MPRLMLALLLEVGSGGRLAAAGLRSCCKISPLGLAV